jgi:apolipoprotein N-acyltransferase
LTGRSIPYLLAAAAGLAQAAAIASPWDGQPQWWLQLISLAVLAGLLQRCGRALQGAALGWAFALAWLTATYWWLYISMHVYGGLPAPLAALAVLALAAFLGSYYALAAGLFVRLRFAGSAAAALLFGALWLLAELMRATWFTGFPWGAGGYAHPDGPLRFLAPLVGVYGIGFVAALLAYGLSLLARKAYARSWAYWGCVAAAVALLAACNFATQADTAGGATAAPPDRKALLKVALLQGNIPQDEKFQGGTGIPVALTWYGEQLLRQQASLVVAPETALPLLPLQLPAGYLEALRASFASGERAALVGIPMGSFEERYTNSAFGWKPGAPDNRYDKHHLVPFGEFIPPLFKWFTRMMNIPLGDFNRGAVGQPSFEWQGQRLAPNICYEDLFGEELAARFNDPATAPTIFVNLSNIAWFGNSIAIDQHLQISRMRSLEFERPMIRATNTGATVVIDHRGVVTHSLPRHTRGVLLAQVEGRSGITPFAGWSARFGLWPLWAIGLLTLALALRRARRN